MIGKENNRIRINLYGLLTIIELERDEKVRNVVLDSIETKELKKFLDENLK